MKKQSPKLLSAFTILGKISYDSIDDIGNIEEIGNEIIEVNKALYEIKASQQ